MQSRNSWRSIVVNFGRLTAACVGWLTTACVGRLTAASFGRLTAVAFSWGALAPVLAIAVVLAAPGCGHTSSLDRGIILGELEADHLASRMLAGETPREEEQELIVKNLATWRELRESRGLVHPGKEGPLARDFQRILSTCSSGTLRELAWAILALSVTNPSLDLRKSSCALDSGSTQEAAK